MEEDYALFVLRREQQALSLDTQLQGPGPNVLYDHRIIYLESLGNAIDLIEKNGGLKK